MNLWVGDLGEGGEEAVEVVARGSAVCEVEARGSEGGA